MGSSLHDREPVHDRAPGAHAPAEQRGCTGSTGIRTAGSQVVRLPVVRARLRMPARGYAGEGRQKGEIGSKRASRISADLLHHILARFGADFSSQ